MRPGSHRRWLSDRSLSARGRLLNAFLGLGSFLALTLLGIGLYLIDQQFVDPLRASEGALVTAALLLTTSLAIFAALLHPTLRPVARRSSHSRHGAPPAWPMILSPGAHRVRQTGPGIGEQAPRGYPQRRYVDLARIRL